MIIGVSDETEQKLADHIAAKGIKYPIVRAPGAMGTYGGKFYPSYFMVSPEGEIVSTPAERIPSDEWLREALTTVTRVPELPDDARFDPLRKAWEKQDYKRIDDYLTKMLQQEDLDAELRTVFEAQRSDFDAMLERTATRIDKLAAGPDYWASKKALERIADEFDGLGIEEKAREVLDRFDDDDAIKKEITASRTYEKLLERYDANKISQRRKLVDALLKFEERYAGSHAATVAAKYREQLGGG